MQANASVWAGVAPLPSGGRSFRGTKLIKISRSALERGRGCLESNDNTRTQHPKRKTRIENKSTMEASWGSTSSDCTLHRMKPGRMALPITTQRRPHERYQPRGRLTSLKGVSPSRAIGRTRWQRYGEQFTSSLRDLESAVTNTNKAVFEKKKGTLAARMGRRYGR